jgi:ribosomal-protein-alanine N-acetyltransferase
MTVSKLTKCDCKIIAALFERAFDDGWTEKMLLSAFDTERFHALGVFDGDDLVGAITFSYSVDTADIEDVAVDNAYRKKGIGERLVNKALDKIKEDKKEKVFLEARANNIPAINLYQKVGFENLSVRKKYYDDGEDAVVMVKEIAL